MLAVQSDTKLTQTSWSRGECTQEAVNELVFKKFIEIVRDYNQRMEGYEKNLQVLEKGYWYGNDYALALQKKGAQSSLEWFRDRGKFFHGHPPSKMVHVRDSGISTGLALNGYLLKEGEKPSEALRSFRESICFIDCQEAIELAYYDALLEIWGMAKFDEVFSKKESKFSLSPDIDRTPLAPKKLTKLEVFKDLDCQFFSSLKKGDQVFFKHISGYNEKHRNGEAAGYHCLSFGTAEKRRDIRYVAFGLVEKGLTEVGMHQELVRVYNQDPIDPKLLHKNPEEDGFMAKDYPKEMKMQSLQKSESLKKSKISLEMFQNGVKQVKEVFGTYSPHTVGLGSYRVYLDAAKVRSHLPK